jgi:hypothetical protein
MTMQFVPYVLVLCGDVFGKSKFRREPFYFTFAKRYGRITELWAAPRAVHAVGLWRVYPSDHTTEFEGIRPAGLWVPPHACQRRYWYRASPW